MRSTTCRTVLTAIYVVVVTLVLCGCDMAYEIVVENLSGETIVVRTDHVFVAIVESCMAQVGYPMGPSTFSEELHVNVFSEEGDLMEERTLVTTNTSGRLPRATLRYEGSRSELCGEPIEDVIRVEVANKSEKDLAVTIDAQSTVHVQPSALVTVTVRGSITGQPPRISVASADPGFRLAERYRVSDFVRPYRIGDPPLLRVFIRTASRKYSD